jgi:hypothetical protein
VSDFVDELYEKQEKSLGNGERKMEGKGTDYTKRT